MPRHRSGRHGHKRDYVLPRRSSHEQDAQTPTEASPHGVQQASGANTSHRHGLASHGTNHRGNLAAPIPMGSTTTSNAPNHVRRPIFVPKLDIIYNDDLARARRNLQLEKSVLSSAGRTRPKLRADDAFGQGPSVAAGIAEPERPADEPAAQSEGQIVDMGWKELLGMLEQKVGALEAENRKLQHENRKLQHENRKLQHENDQFRAWSSQAPK